MRAASGAAPPPPPPLRRPPAAPRGGRARRPPRLCACSPLRSPVARRLVWYAKPLIATPSTVSTRRPREEPAAVISVMREYARSLKCLLLTVVAVFILTSGVLFYFGSGPFGSGKSNAVAVANGEEIPPERFKRAQANMMAAYPRMARQQLTPDLAEPLPLPPPAIKPPRTPAT